MFPYTIKPMETLAEMDGKGYVHYKSWQETYAGLVDAAYLRDVTEEKCVKRAREWPDNLLVAKDGERVIGFVGYGLYRDDTLPGCGEVYALYVLADYHDQRVGYELMNAAFEKLSAFQTIALWVLKGNERAIRFYQRYGFRPDGVEQEILLGVPNTVIRMIRANK